MSGTESQVAHDLAPAGEGRRANVLVRLYRGETAFDFVGRRRWWYLLSGLVILAGLVSLGVRGLNLGIDFKGGTSWEVPAHGVTVAQATKAVEAVGVTPSVVEGVGVGSSAHLQVEADLTKLPVAQRTAVEDKVAVALAHLTHTPVSQAEKDVTDVGPTWGSQITHKAVLAVIVFFVVVVLYISFRFEWKMAVAALVAVLHDLLVVAGVYSLSGLQVTPDTVVAVLTILGYSLYDTVVVFDRVADNAKGLGATRRMTYEDVVNLSMNQTLARSINTSLVAILPVLSVLVIGAQLLGATTLQYFGFALVIGLLSGAYSSIFIASPLLAQLKEREPRYRSLRERLAAGTDRGGLLTPKAAAQLALAGSGSARPASRAGSRGAARPGRARGASGPSAGGPAPLLRPGQGRSGRRLAQVDPPGATGDGQVSRDEDAGAPGSLVEQPAAVGGSAAGSNGGAGRAGSARPATQSAGRPGAAAGARRAKPPARRKGGAKRNGRRR
jgi:preprotein translocase subunit SecF